MLAKMMSSPSRAVSFSRTDLYELASEPATEVEIAEAAAQLEKMYGRPKRAARTKPQPAGPRVMSEAEMRAEGFVPLATADIEASPHPSTALRYELLFVPTGERSTVKAVVGDDDHPIAFMEPRRRKHGFTLANPAAFAIRRLPLPED